jgi:two-component system, LytTR family, sensor kinase
MPYAPDSSSSPTSDSSGSHYWRYQIAGWLGYSAIGIGINLLNGAALAPLIAGHVGLIGCSIGLTHRLRADIRRRRHERRPFSAMRLFLATRVLRISLIQAAVVIGLNMAITGSTWPVTAVVALWWGMLLATGVWTLLYVRFSETRRHTERETELQLAVREAELTALEAQINPHFLFNCLNSIRALVTIDPERAQDMLTRLANVLRSSLRQDRAHTVPLATELATVSDYLALEAVRFEERLHARVLADPEVAQYAVPPLVLQTLVENAIKHGIAHVAGHGMLTVRGDLIDGRLRLTVENTGTLNESAASPTRLGLANVRDRLRLLYGDQASVQLEGADNRVRATVLIPLAR